MVIVGDSAVSSETEVPVITPQEFSHSFLDSLEVRRGETEPELRTGFPTLDEMLWGLRRGEVITIGARTSRGKSTFALNVALNLIKTGKTVVYFSTEMSAEEKWCRILSRETDIHASKFRRASFDESEWSNIIKTAEFLHNNNKLLICELASPSVVDVGVVVFKYKPDVVILDYINLFSLPKEDRKDLMIGEFMKGVKIISRRGRIASVVISQLNRGVDLRMDKTPYLSDLKESGSIEQESDVVILLSDADPEFNRSPSRVLNCSIEKNRHGATGLVKIDFYAPTFRMTEREII